MDRMDSVWVAFIEPETPGNIGFLARTMKNFGLRKLILVGGCEMAEETWTFSMHAKDVLKGAKRMTWRELLDRDFDFKIGTTCRQGNDHNLARVAIDPQSLGQSLRDIEGNVCILLGREGNGLSLEEIELCDIVVKIPSSPDYPPLNVTHAAAVIFYEAFRHVSEPGMRGMREASAEEKRVLLDTVDGIIASSGLPKHRKRMSSLVFRRVVNRAFISGRECHTLIGLIKSISESRGD